MSGTAVWALRWSDVDPEGRVFDRSRVRAIAEAVLREHRTEKRGRSQEAEDAVDRALLSEFGPWVAGWRWAASEPGGGGPVQSYCCPRDSLGGSAAEASDAVAKAAAQWHERLRALARTFGELRTEGLPPEDAAPRAAARLLPLVVDWTRAEDAWYATFGRFVVWALEYQGIAPADAESLVHRAICGRFESWVAPDERTSEDVFRALGAAMRSAPRERGDATEQWLGLRDEVRWDSKRYYRPGPVRRDGHDRYVEEVDRVRDEVRAHRMKQALERVRRRASKQEPMNLSELTRWQGIVLGGPAKLRSSDAFAHEGRQRYGIRPDLRERTEACLAQATERGMGVIARAARVYLDICFLHPFEDGNARAARLALDYVLTRDGLALHAAGPVFLVARQLTDGGDASRFAWIVDYLAGPRGT